MDAITAISLSGLNAAQLQLQSSADNVANMDDQAPLPGSGIAGPAPYAPTSVSQVNLGAGGVQAQLQASTAPPVAAYAPASPYANAGGLVATPNVDLAAQGVNEVQALAAFRASLATLKVEDQMQKSLLDVVR